MKNTFNKLTAHIGAIPICGFSSNHYRVIHTHSHAVHGRLNHDIAPEIDSTTILESTSTSNTSPDLPSQDVSLPSGGPQPPLPPSDPPRKTSDSPIQGAFKNVTDPNEIVFGITIFNQNTFWNFFYNLLSLVSNVRKMGQSPIFDPGIVIEPFRHILAVLVFCHLNYNGPHRVAIDEFLKRANLFTAGIPEFMQDLIDLIPNFPVPISGYSNATISYRFGTWAKYREIIEDLRPSNPFFLHMRELAGLWQQFKFGTVQIKIGHINQRIFAFYTLWSGKSSSLVVAANTFDIKFSDFIKDCYFYAFFMPYLISGRFKFIMYGFILRSRIPFTLTFFTTILLSQIIIYIKANVDTSRTTIKIPFPGDSDKAINIPSDENKVSDSTTVSAQSNDSDSSDSGLDSATSPSV